MTFDDVAKAISEARSVLRMADGHVAEMARVCVGRLQSSGVSIYTLKQLKNELRNFNIHTSTWKD